MADELSPEALAALPVFPLPAVVLFPGALLPLHIFEPRYRAMTRHCLDTHGLLAMAQLVEAPAAPSVLPPIASVVGVGRIVEHVALPDGRYHLLLRGEARAKLEELPFAPPFRRARATLLADVGPAVTSAQLQSLRTLARTVLDAVRTRVKPEDLGAFELPPDADVDAIAAALVTDPDERQKLLEELSPSARADRTLDLLARAYASLRRPSAGPAN